MKKKAKNWNKRLLRLCRLKTNHAKFCDFLYGDKCYCGYESKARRLYKSIEDIFSKRGPR